MSKSLDRVDARWVIIDDLFNSDKVEFDKDKYCMLNDIHERVGRPPLSALAIHLKSRYGLKIFRGTRKFMGKLIETCWVKGIALKTEASAPQVTGLTGA
jgi:hypothetical protein